MEMEDQELAKALEESSQSTTPNDPNALLPTDKFTEKQVSDLIALGFSRAQVRIIIIYIKCLFTDFIKIVSFLHHRFWKNWENSMEIQLKQQLHFSQKLSNFKVPYVR